MFLFLLFIPIFSFAHAYAGDVVGPSTPVTLPPIIVEGSASDALLYDPIVPPAKESRLDHSMTDGSATKKMADELPISIGDRGTPGSLSQFRGVGQGAEDTNIQTLGIPFNPPQGGGFDFATFPQFFWSNYQFQTGAGGGAYDPGSSAGTVTLVPWTADALRARGDQGRVSQLVGNAVSQTSIAGKSGDVAALGGFSAGAAVGPTGSISARAWQGADGSQVRFHLLGSSIDAKTPGSMTFQTPNAHQLTARAMGVMESDLALGRGKLLKSSLFTDRGWVRFSDPDHSTFSFDQTRQWGMENALLIDDWTFGLSGRVQSLQQVSFSPPSEGILHLSAARVLRSGQDSFEVRGEGDAVGSMGQLSQTTWKPGASLGARHDLDNGVGIYARTGLSYRFPTLSARYYQDPFFQPNPGLLPERVFSGTLGVDWTGRDVKGGVSAFGQLRNNAQLTTTVPGNTSVFTTVNEGNVKSVSFIQNLTWSLDPMLDLDHSVRLGFSDVEQINEPIPYDPLLTEVVEAQFHSPGDHPEWRAALGARALTDSKADFSGTKNPGYALFHASAAKSFKQNWIGKRGDATIEARLDNILNRPVQVVQGYPLPGRRIFVAFIAGF